MIHAGLCYPPLWQMSIREPQGIFRQNRNDTAMKWVLDKRCGQVAGRPEMQNLDRDRALDRYRAMESLCRQSAVFRPLESWRLLAEAEMWHHKALEEISSRAPRRDDIAQSAVSVRSGSPSSESKGSRSLAG